MGIPDGVSLNCSVRLDINELTRRLSREQIEALFEGIAKVLAADRDDNLQLAALASQSTKGEKES